jgi:hypothetical protein
MKNEPTAVTLRIVWLTFRILSILLMIRREGSITVELIR